MADVRFTIEVTIPNKSDAVVLAAIQAVDITPVTEEREDWFTVCNDVSSISAPGTIQRVITAELSSDFESKFPTNNDQLHALYRTFKYRFAKQMAARVEESVSIGAFCP